MSKRLAMEHFKTWGDVQRVLSSVQNPCPDGPSRLNPSLTRQQVFDILSGGIAHHFSDEEIDWQNHQALAAVNVWKEYVR